MHKLLSDRFPYENRSLNKSPTTLKTMHAMKMTSVCKICKILWRIYFQKFRVKKRKFESPNAVEISRNMWENVNLELRSCTESTSKCYFIASRGSGGLGTCLGDHFGQIKSQGFFPQSQYFRTYELIFNHHVLILAKKLFFDEKSNENYNVRCCCISGKAMHPMEMR